MFFLHRQGPTKEAGTSKSCVPLRSMETMTEGRAVEELKLPSSSLGLPGLKDHLPQVKDSLCNGSVERISSDGHINGVLEGGSHEKGLQEGSHGTNNELLFSKLDSMNGRVHASPSPKGDTSPCGIMNGEVHGTPSPHSEKFLCEQKNDGSKHEETPHSDEKETLHRQGNWVYAEILVLLEAKVKEHALACGESRRNRQSADDKWKQVSEYCKSKGVQRTKEQCRVKWDNMMPDYRKVRDYEQQKGASAPSYFEMDIWERRMKLLPGNLDMEIYQRIASIQSNKPTKGGLKREAREKRSLELSNVLSPSLHSLRRSCNGAEGITGADLEGERPLLADLVGKHIASSAPRKRRRRRAVELAFPEKKVEPVAKIDVQMRDDSSTEDDAAVVSSRSQQATPSTACMYAERSCVVPSHQRYESRELLPVAFRSQNALQQAASVMVERGNSSSALEGAGAKGVCLQETSDGIHNHDAVNRVEDRKDARHREFMALEREKLAVFREASFAIANAMTNAMTVFSKVAEELLLRRG